MADYDAPIHDFFKEGLDAIQSSKSNRPIIINIGKIVINQNQPPYQLPYQQQIGYSQQPYPQQIGYNQQPYPQQIGYSQLPYQQPIGYSQPIQQIEYGIPQLSEQQQSFIAPVVESTHQQSCFGGNSTPISTSQQTNVVQCEQLNQRMSDNLHETITDKRNNLKLVIISCNECNFPCSHYIFTFYDLDNILLITAIFDFNTKLLTVKNPDQIAESIPLADLSINESQICELYLLVQKYAKKNRINSSLINFEDTDNEDIDSVPSTPASSPIQIPDDNSNRGVKLFSMDLQYCTNDYCKAGKRQHYHIYDGNDIIIVAFIGHTTVSFLKVFKNGSIEDIKGTFKIEVVQNLPIDIMKRMFQISDDE